MSELAIFCATPKFVCDPCDDLAPVAEMVELVARLDDGARGARAIEMAERMRADLATADARAEAGQLAGKTVLTP